MNTRKVMHVVLSCSLYLSSPLPFAYAANSDTGALSNVAAGLSSAMDTAAQTFLGIKNQQHQMNMMLLAYRNSNVSLNFTPAKYFPQCAILPAQMDVPEQACTKISSSAELQQAEYLAKTALDRRNLLDQMLSGAQNSQNPVGVKCLEDALSKQMTAIDDKINSLTSISNNIKKANQAFKEQNKANLEELRAINDELEGTKNSAKGATFDLQALFKDSACGEVLNQYSFTNGGLRGVRNSMSAPNNKGKGLIDLANNMVNDQASITAQIQKQADRVAAAITKNGAWEGANYLTSTNELTRGGLTKFPAVQEAIARKKTELENAYNRINTYLQNNLGYNLPALDRHFAGKISNFSKDAAGYFKKKMVDDCVTMKDSTGLGLSRDQILNSLRQKSTGSSGTTTKSYRDELDKILKSDAFIEEKLAKIQALDNKFGKGNITMTLSTSNGQQTLSPYDALANIVARCEARFNEDNTYSANSANTNSQAAMVAEAQKYVNEIRDLEKNFATELASEIRDELISCTGKAKESSGTCDSDRMNPTNDNFCVSSALACATNVQTCYSKAEGLVKNRELKAKAKSALYNANVASLVAMHETYLKQIQSRVFADTEFFKNYFPDSSWKMPEDLFVSMPELSSGAGLGLGSELLRAGGNQDFLDELPKKIASLKEVLDAQKTKIASSITNYIGEQRSAMQKNQEKWGSVYQTCLAASKGYREQVAQSYNEAAKKRAEEDSKVGEFCQRYTDLVGESNPVGACSGDNSPADLATEATKISSYLDPSVQLNIKDFKNLCSQVQSEKTSSGGENEKKEVEVPGLADMCSDEGNSWSTVRSSLVSQVLDQIPAEIATKKEELQKFFDGKSDEGSSLDSILDNVAIQKSPWGKNLKTLKAKLDDSEKQAGTEKNVCAFMNSKIEEKSKIDPCLVPSAYSASGTPSSYTMKSDCDKDEELAKVKQNLRGMGSLESLNAFVKKMNLGQTESQIGKQWSEIGEKWGSTCKAGAGTTYSNRLLGEFNKIINANNPASAFGSSAVQGVQ